MVVTLTGLDGVRDTLATAFTYLGIGTGTTTPTEDDTDLEDEVFRIIQSSVDTSVSKKFTTEFVIPSLAANGNFISEIGMFDADIVVIDDCNATTGWAVSGGATNLTLDTSDYKEPTGSLNFDMDGVSATGILTKTLSSAEDLSGENFVYAWVYVADTTNLTSVDFYISSAGTGTDYYQWTFLTSSLTDASWNLLKCDVSSPDSTLGSTTLSNINDIQLDITQSSATASTDWRLDDLRGVDQVMFNRELVPIIEKTNLKEFQYEITVTVDNK